MIEILVALVITSLALLGLAALQINALRYQKLSHFRGLAAHYGGEVADRIRANMSGATGGFYATASTEKYADGAGAKPGCKNAANCTTEEVAKLDLYNWRVNLARGMTQGWGEITGDTASGFTILVYFREPSKNDDAIDPNCRPEALDSGKDKDVRCFSLKFVP